MANQFLGRVRLTITTNGKKSVWEYGPAGLVKNSIMIQFSAPFSHDNTPSVITLDLYNISPNTQNFIRKGSTVILEAGYATDLGVISEGTISYVYPRTSEGTGDIKTSFSFLEGTDYSKNKDIKLSLSSGISGLDAINRIAQASGITISELKLPNSKSYSDGYSVDGSSMDAIDQIATDCGAEVYYKRGRLVVNHLKDTVGTELSYDAEHGLIGYPQPLDWDPENNVSGFSVELLLNHRISVGSPIKLNSKYGGGGIYRFQNGTHSFDGTNFRTTGEVI
jgi:hypothetical protein